MTQEQQKTAAATINVAIGYEVSQLLNLKFGKDGRTKTSWGTNRKTILLM